MGLVGLILLVIGLVVGNRAKKQRPPAGPPDSGPNRAPGRVLRRGPAGDPPRRSAASGDAVRVSWIDGGSVPEGVRSVLAGRRLDDLVGVGLRGDVDVGRVVHALGVEL